MTTCNLVSIRQKNTAGLQFSVYLFLMIQVHFLSYVSSTCIQMIEGGQPALFCQFSVPHLPLSSSEMRNNLTKLQILGIKPESRHIGVLGPYNLTGLESLTYLQLNNFNLVHIEADTFRRMRMLKTLDLSENRISVIQPGAFNGLSLDLLSLSDNPRLALNLGTFHGAKVRHLAARNCGLKRLPYDVVAEAKPRQLSLSNNQLTWLDPLFENLVKPQTSPVPTISLGNTGHQDNDKRITWGYIDLSGNPLDCSCQLVWLSKMIERQLYDSQRIQSHVKEKNPEADVPLPSRTSSSSSNRLMHHLNMKCASPSHLAQQRIPHSWSFFCPIPQVVGIDVDLLTSSADMAQLTCIGRGQPAPSLAWTYRIQGQKVQRTLDPSVQQRLWSQSLSGYRSNNLVTNQLIERRFSLNVSLENPAAKNFTCTVWNNDALSSHHFSSDLSRRLNHYDQSDRYGMDNSLNMPRRELRGPTATEGLRMHEVTVRISGPTKRATSLSPLYTLATLTNHTSESINKRETTAEPMKQTPPNRNQNIDPAAGHSSESEGYTYLFDKRFTLLQLLGAVLGTFCFTLLLLLLVTRFCSCFCQLPQLPMKTFATPQVKSPSKWFNWWNKADHRIIRANPGADLANSHSVAERTQLIDAKRLFDSNAKIAGNFKGFDPSSTHSTTLLQSQEIPQAYLLSGISLPSMARCSTPPPNPTYWPMPEYTYTGASGSHEYDVPRPIEPMPLSSKPHSLNHNPNAQLLLSQRPLPAIGGTTPFQPSNLGPGGHLNLFQTVSAMHTNPWRNGQVSTVGGGQPPFTTLNSLGGPHGLHFQDRVTSGHNHNHHLQYGHYPVATVDSQLPMIYSGDYPTYLQTRPYPHYPPSQSQPLLELVTSANVLTTCNEGADTADTGLGSIATDGGMSKEDRRGSGQLVDDDYTPNTNLSVGESDT